MQLRYLFADIVSCIVERAQFLLNLVQCVSDIVVLIVKSLELSLINEYFFFVFVFIFLNTLEFNLIFFHAAGHLPLLLLQF